MADVVDLERVARLVVVDHRAAPAATVAAAKGERRGIGAHGSRTYEASALRIDAKSPFDLASVTKPFVALTLVRLEKRGLLSRSEALGDLAPELRKAPAARVSLDLLASHRSGLEAHQRLFSPLERGESVDPEGCYIAAASALRAECSGPAPVEGFPAVYSDMGYLLLGRAMEVRCGKPLDQLVREEVLDPLRIATTVGSARQMRALDAAFDSRVLPTEVVPFRGGLVCGSTHDENAFAIVGDALAGHAGLFGDAASVLAFGLAVRDAAADRSDWLSPPDLEPVLRHRPNGTHLAGFDSRSGDTPSSGSRVGARTFGHLGFAGTSLWIDPDSAFVGVLLTNRVHPTRDHIAIRAARPAAYDAMFDALSDRSPPSLARGSSE